MSETKRVDLAPDLVRLEEAGARTSRIALAVGVIGLAAGALLGAAKGDGWTAFFHSYLSSFAFFMSLTLGGLFFVLIQHVTRAGWSVVVRRFAETVATNALVPMAFLAVPVLLGLHRLYEWTDTAKVAGDHLLHAKAPYLNVPFFLVRTAVYFGVWVLLAAWFHRQSVRQDGSGDTAATLRMEKVAPVGTILFALTTTFFAFDYLMSLTPHWSSTIFGVYYFAGCLVGFFALCPLIALWVRWNGRLQKSISAEHFHDMGKLAFAFVVFWAYIGFSQFMLMWYANLPEETAWYAPRMTGGWATVSWILLFGHFLAPFLFLMSRHMKRRNVTLLVGVCWILAMHWLDLYWIVMPSLSPDAVPLGPMDVALFLGIGGIWTAAAARRLSRHALVPVRDPRLGESLQFENI